MVTQQVRHFPANRTLARLVRDGDLGALTAVTMQQLKHRPTPYPPSPHQQIWQMSVHDLDTLRAVIGAEAEWIVAHDWRPPWTAYPTPPAVSAIIGFGGGVVATYVGSSDAAVTSYELRLELERGALVQRGFYGGSLTLERQGHPPEAIAHDEPEDGVDPTARMIDLFVRWIEGGPEPDVSGRANLATMRLVDACVRAAETGRRVTLREA
jgi:predicted dehydrogenase